MKRRENYLIENVGDLIFMDYVKQILVIKTGNEREVDEFINQYMDFLWKWGIHEKLLITPETIFRNFDVWREEGKLE